MTTAPTPSLLPCPFCGGGETIVQEGSKPFPRLKYRQPTSVVVMHRCTSSKDARACTVTLVGPDRASAIAAWNQRAELEARKPLPLSDDDRLRLRSDVARAIWDVMREHEDRCDHALEDVDHKHQVWDCADAAIRAMKDKP